MRITVKGADGASVSYRPTGKSQSQSQSQAVTVRAARDGSGAPPLPAGYTAAGSVYQFTPLGLARPGIEVRIPIDEAVTKGGAVTLLVAQPGGPWMQLTDVKTESHSGGRWLVAAAPQLSYAAAVVASGNGTTTANKTGANHALQASAAPSSIKLALSVDASSSPTVPAPTNDASYSVITQPTQLVIAVDFDLVGACDGNKTVTVIARVAGC